MQSSLIKTVLSALALTLVFGCSANSPNALDNTSTHFANDTEHDSDQDGDQPTNDTQDTQDTQDTKAPDQTTCAPYKEDVQTGQLSSPESDEASGLAASWNHNDLLWTHNDSGDTARLFAMRTDGSTVAIVHLTSVKKAIDWEDIAIAPCQAGTEIPCIYIADTGDNLKNRKQVVIYRFPEPTFDPDFLSTHTSDTPPIELNIEDANEIWLTYPEGPRDVETLMVHPQTSAIYLVEKNDTPNAPVFRITNPPIDQNIPPETPTVATQIATLHHEGLDGLFAMLTAGDISPNGREFTVRTYLHAFTYCMPDTVNSNDDTPLTTDVFETTFSAHPLRYGLPFLKQAESLTYDRNGHAIWITSEGKHAPIYKITRAETANLDEP